MKRKVVSVKQRKEILVFINYYNSKTESFILSQLEFFKKKGLDYSLLAYNYAGSEKGIYSVPIGSNFKERLANIKLNSWKKLWLFFSSLKFKSGWNLSLYQTGLHFLDHQYDFIYCHFGTNGKLIAQLKNISVINAQTQIIVQFHGLDLNRKKYGTDYYSIFNREVEYVIYGSDLAFRLLQEFTITKPKNLKIPVSIDFSKLHEVSRERDIKDTVKLISVGRLIPLKGHEIALNLISLLKLKTSKKILFEIIGDGHLKSALENKIKALGLEREVLLSGWKSHDDVLKTLAGSHIYLYTGIQDQDGRVEMQGLANLEAMALGLTVVSTDVGGVGEIVLDQKNGIIIDPNELEAASEKLRNILENYEDHNHLRLEAKSHVFAHYNMDKVYQVVLDILN
ncbi:glycosyltransferase family 4 protein [Mongoliibacter ruber]|uniref:glycosyltransferase family 4 protein n=1 Tax=Mongoliibacter ruber TaxID=1750599 RepID=UPI000D06D597|nr:glycosyltransferase family 4 protein [Mongoliibacter ruber]